MTLGFGALEGYELDTELGRGGMGRVLRARHGSTGTIRAVKLLDGVPGPEEVERFRREAQALARVSGEGVVPIHEIGVLSGRLAIVLGFMTGGSLRSRLETAGRLEWREAARLAIELARTLETCHAAGLVHRDVKPENVLFDDRGRARLSDFGCVRELGRTITQTGWSIGTPAYMSPEQLAGDRVDGRADVFSLAVVLFELITGEKPFPDEPAVARVATIRAGRRQSVRESVPEVPRAIDAAIDRALAPRASDRPSAAGFASELELALSAPATRRSRAWVVGAAAFVATAATAILVARRPPGDSSRPNEPEKPAVIASATVAPAIEDVVTWGDRAWLHNGPVSSVAFADDGKSVLSAGWDGVRLWTLDGREAMDPIARSTPVIDSFAGWLRLPERQVLAWGPPGLSVGDPATGRFIRRPLPDVKHAALGESGAVVEDFSGRVSLWPSNVRLSLAAGTTVSALGLSPDMRVAGVGCRDGSVHLYDPQGREWEGRWLTEDAVRSIAISRGTAIAVGLEHGKVVLDRPSKGFVFWPAHTQAVHTLAFSREGDLLASGSADRSVRVWEVEGGNDPVWTIENAHEWYVNSVAFSPDSKLLATGGSDNAVRVWSIENRKLLAGPRPPGHGSQVFAVAIAPDGRVLSAGHEGVFLHDPVTGAREPIELTGRRDPVVCLALASHGTAIAAAGPYLQMIALAERAPRGLPVKVLDGRSHVTTISLSGSALLVATEGGTVARYRVEGGQISLDAIVLAGDGASARARADARGDKVLLTHGEGLVSLLSPAGKAIHFPPQHRRDVKSIAGVALSPDGTRGATVGHDGQVVLWDVKERRVRWSGAAEPGEVLFTPDGRRLITGGSDGVVRLWDVETGSLLAKNGAIVAAGDSIMSLAIAGDRLVAGTARGAIVTFRLR
jgi:WD40 repeat protein